MTHVENALLTKIAPRPAAEHPRPSVLSIARKVLWDTLEIEPNGKYMLWRNGRWCQVNLDEVMRAVNQRLKSQGNPQILLNPGWSA